MSLERIFLGWDRPVVTLAVERFAAGADGPLFDLGGTVVVVPTRQSARRLREGLARSAAERDTGILSPFVVTPDFFLQPRGRTRDILSSAEATAVWAAVLGSFDLDELSDLFPVKPVSQSDPGWILGIVDQLCGLRDLLVENGLFIRDVAAKGLDAVEEPDRWNALARLEGEYMRIVESMGREDSLEAKVRNSLEPIALDGVEKIVVLAVPDPTPLAVAALGRLSGTCPVEIWIHAPAELCDGFDEWGRPVPERWEEAVIEFPSDDLIRLKGDAKDQADEVVRIVRQESGGGDPPDFAVASPDAGLFSFIETAFAREGVDVYNPAGEPVSRSSIFQLIRSVKEVFFSGSYSSFSSLVRNPDFLKYISARSERFDCAGLMSQLDTLQNDHLPGKLKDIGDFLAQKKEGSCGELRSAYEAVSGFARRTGGAKGPIGFVREVLSKIYAGRGGDLSDESFGRVADKANAVNSALEEIEGDPVDGLKLPDELVMEILQRELSRRNVYPEHHPAAVPVQGWLETHWETAKTIVIAGMNEGIVPESVVGDLFLPDPPRVRLGLKSNRQRFARDVYLLTAMIKCRPGGKVFCIAGKRDTRGNPVKPSRLLFLCPEESLVKRATALFAEIEDVPRLVRPARLWRLRPPVRPAPDRISVTAFRDYLQCPFRFYLGRVVGMERLDDAKVEADAMDFGILCHRPLEAMVKRGGLDGCDDRHALAAFLQAEAERHMHERFGRDLSLALEIQLDSAKMRLAAAARIEAGERSDGWKTLYTEYKVSLKIGGMTVAGKIDRIDKRGEEVRVLDYKTSDSARTPFVEHLKTGAAEGREWASLTIGGKAYSWKGLQLPMYRFMLGSVPEFSGSRIRCGFFNMPKAASDAGIAYWDGLDEQCLESAYGCAEKIVERIKNREFWPPGADVEYDEFECLYTKSMESSVDGEYFQKALGHEEKK